jgi:hypothetical protein
MSIKFTSSEGSAYEVAVGVTAEEAAEAGLAIVEYAYSTTPPQPIYGRYKNAPDGAPLGITVDKRGETEVIGGGSVSGAPVAVGGKGDLINRNDPFIHGATGEESVHKDGAEPPVRDIAAEEKEAREIAEKSIEDASKRKSHK